MRMPNLVAITAMTIVFFLGGMLRPSTADAQLNLGLPLRLSDAVRPLKYRLDLNMQVREKGLDGFAEIELAIRSPTKVILLHGNGLRVTDATFLDDNDSFYVGRYEQLDDQGAAQITFGTTLPSGLGLLRVRYSAPYRSRSDGPYKAEVDGREYIFTQFQPIDARRLFPGFDQPEFKTPFDIEVTTEAGNVVIGNMPVANERRVGSDLKRVQLATTPPVPTYLVALAIGPFDISETILLRANAVRRRNLPLRAAATHGNGDKLEFALKNTSSILAYLEEYFGREYPFEKLDLISSPQLGFGGMENVGAIIYGDQQFLVAKSASLEQKRGFGVLHAHELAHQWFGNLVTPKWWDDLWLNESFANWLSYKAAHKWAPELQIDIVPAIEAGAVMRVDSRITARSIRQPITSSGAIENAFDAITYLKGASVLTMFEQYLGEEVFRAGIREYIRRHENSVADVDDFMAALVWASGRPDVIPALRSFVIQSGVPLVQVAVTCQGSDSTLRVVQSRYLPFGSKGDSSRTWKIPFCFRYGNDVIDNIRCEMLDDRIEHLQLRSTACPAIVMPNAEGAGYYRFSLQSSQWPRLLAQLQYLSQAEALALADSMSAAYQANQLSTADMVAGIRKFSKSDFSRVALVLQSELLRMHDMPGAESVQPAIRSLMRELYRPRYEQVRGVVEPLADIADGAVSANAINASLFRTNLVRLLALFADDQVLIAQLAMGAERYVRIGEQAASLNVGALPAALVPTALRVGVQQKGARFVDTLVDRMVSSSDMAFRSQAASALGNTDDSLVGKQVRGLVLDRRLNVREPLAILFSLSARSSQRHATFEWLKDNLKEVVERIPSRNLAVLPTLASGFCSLHDRDAVETFFRPLVPQLPGSEQTLNETLESIELCAALADAKRQEVMQYFLQERLGLIGQRPETTPIGQLLRDEIHREVQITSDMVQKTGGSSSSDSPQTG